MRIAITADLHWGHGQRGDDATRLLRRHLDSDPVDLLILGGDIGTAEHFDNCLGLFADLPCIKALVPGNHDLWVADDDKRGDSLRVYQQHLPAVCAAHGVHYLDDAPLSLADAGLAIVGNINWYDYSWSLERLKAEVPDWEWRLRTKTFTRGRHNDGRFVQWNIDDVAFTQLVVAKLGRHLDEALKQVPRAIVVTHHPALYGLNFPREVPPQDVDALLWDAFSGNTAVEALLSRYTDKVPWVFSGHTHRERECRVGRTVGLNVGGDYHFKRMLMLDWPAGGIQAHVFGDPNRRR
jgi:predicted phosphohydrolase